MKYKMLIENADQLIKLGNMEEIINSWKKITQNID